jgi:hypothetical protein
MATASAKPNSPYNLSAPDIEEVAQIILGVFRDASEQEALSFWKKFQSGKIALNEAIPSNILTTDNKSQLCPAMASVTPKELVAKMLESKDVTDNNSGFQLKPAALFKQLFFWLAEGYHLHCSWSPVSAFTKSVLPLMKGKTLEELCQDIFREVFQEEAAKAGENIDDLGITVELDETAWGVISTSISLSPNSPSDFVDPVKVKHKEDRERKKRQERQEREEHKERKLASVSKSKPNPAAAGKGKAPTNPSVDQLINGELPRQGKWAQVAAAAAPETEHAQTAPAAGGGGGPAPKAAPAAPAPAAVKLVKSVPQTPTPAAPAGGGGAAAPKKPAAPPRALEGSPVASAAEIASRFDSAASVPQTPTPAAPAGGGGAAPSKLLVPSMVARSATIKASAASAPSIDPLVVELGALAASALVTTFGFSPEVFATAEAAGQAAVNAQNAGVTGVSGIAAQVMEAMLKTYTTPTPAGSPITALFKIAFQVGEAAAALRRGH